jgi:hypothetical protein
MSSDGRRMGELTTHPMAVRTNDVAFGDLIE